MNVEGLLTVLVPALLGLMVVEHAVAVARGRRVYGQRQTLGNLATAVGNRAVAVGFGLVPLLGYEPLRTRVGVFDWSTDAAWQWVLAFVLVDLALYWRHRLGHEVTLLWNAHAVHHQSAEYNLSAGLRFGWLEEPITFAIPLAVLGVPPEMVLVSYGIGKLYSFVVHTELVPSLGWVDRILVTPSVHRVHHGANPQYLDRNYGNVFSVWDSIFGTFTPEEEPVVYGTVEGLPTYDAFANNVAPWRKMWQRMRRSPSVAVAVQVPLRGPGWRLPPTDLATPEVRFPKRYVLPTFLARVGGTVALLAAVLAVVGLGASAEALGVTGRLLAASGVIALLGVAAWYLDGETGLPGAFPPWMVRGAWRLGGVVVRRALAPRFSGAVVDEMVREAIDAHTPLLRRRITASTFSGQLLQQVSLLALGLYQALRRRGLDRAEAERWTGEATGAVWSRIAAIPWALHRGKAPAARLARTVATTRRVLAPPDFAVRDAGEAGFDVTDCPMRRVFRDEGEESVCVAAMCALDERVAAERGLLLDRSGTLAGGAPCCDFRWRLPGGPSGT